MSIFKRRRGEHEKVRIQVTKGVTSRAMVAQHRGMMPTMLLTFETEDGKEIELELQFEEAFHFTQDALATYYAMAPQVRPISPYIN